MAITHDVLTLEDFLKLPEEKPALEFVDGQVTQKVSPNLPHGALQMELGALINQLLRPRKLGRAFSELRVNFGGQSRVPDVSVYRMDRIPRTPEGKLAQGDVWIPPDIAIEIRSPQQTIQSQLRRCRELVNQGVQLALALVPERESVWIVAPDRPEREVQGDASVGVEAIFPGVVLTPAQIFQALQAE